MNRRFRRLVGDALVTKARIIKDLGNAAVHETRAVAPEKAVTPCASFSTSPIG